MARGIVPHRAALAPFQPLQPLLNFCQRRFAWRHVIVCGPEKLRVSYSFSKQDVPIEALAGLLDSEYLGSSEGVGKHKLAKAVECSSAIVAAYAREGELLRHALAKSGATSRQFRKSSANNKLLLVGFVRASSDGAFAATIHNLIVHPDARRCGIGRNLLRRITSQIYKQGGVTDIGMLAPSKSWSFLEKVDFDEDREQSIPMRFPPASIAANQLIF